MIEIHGIKYITDKEASSKYGYSDKWFQARRYKNLDPVYIKMGGKGRVLYPADKLDDWFMAFMAHKE